MITLIDTIRGISECIEETFGEAPVTKDVQEGFDRPCTFVEPVDLATSLESELRVDEITIEITRFSEFSYKGYLELLEYQKTLSELLLKPIPVSETFYLYPEDVEFELDRNDMFLVCSFALNNIQLVEAGEDVITVPTMEELELEKE